MLKTSINQLSVAEFSEQEGYDAEEHYGFHTSFSTVVRQMKLSVFLVLRAERHIAPSERWGIYIFHGVPAARFWEGDSPIAYRETLKDAQLFASKIFGIANSGQMATIIR